MAWVENFSVPTRDELEQLAVLSTGMVLTVLSWDGYMMSIAKKPLFSTWRFSIDVALVFIYMFFLISSKQDGFWLPILAFVFVLYVIWDFLTVREHLDKYDASLPAADPNKIYYASIFEVFNSYSRGARNEPKINRGPISTLVWAVGFTSLACLDYANLGTAPFQVFVMTALAVTALVIYRIDKSRTFGSADVVGFPMIHRLLLVSSLVLAAVLYFCLSSANRV